jgi:hypothetical protein
MTLLRRWQRPLRVEVAGDLYHVIVHGNERESVFRDDADREWYLVGLASYRVGSDSGCWRTADVLCKKEGASGK